MTTDAQQAVLAPEMTTAQAMQLVAQGKVTTEDYLKWDAERVARIKAAARMSDRARNGHFCVKVGQAGGIVLSGNAIGVAAFRPINLRAHQLLQLLLAQNARKVLATIRAQTIGKPVRAEQRTTKDRDGNARAYQVHFLGDVLVDDPDTFPALLERVEKQYAE